MRSQPEQHAVTRWSAPYDQRLAIIADTPATTAENPDTERSSKMIDWTN
jgi:hypothetical protein